MNGFADVTDLARLTARDPRGGARAILAMQLPMRTLWELLVLVSVLTDILLFAELAVGGNAGPEDVQMLIILALGPLRTAALLFGLLLVTAFMLYRVGRAFGGKGDLAGALALLIWLQFIVLTAGAVELALFFVVPVLAVLLRIGFLVVQMWLLIHFTAELHRFTNLWLVAFGIVGTAVVLIFGLSFLLVAFGVPIPGVA